MKIEIPKPCSQKWDDLSPSGENKHCSLCQKVIVDYTKYSNKALVDLISKSDGEVCGKFLSSQLNHDLTSSHNPFQRKHFFSRFLSCFLLMTAPAPFVRAQIQTENITPSISNTKVPSSNFLAGIVVDSDGNPLPFVKVEIVELKLYASTDFDGKFSFKLPVQTDSMFTLGIRENLYTEVVYFENIKVNEIQTFKMKRPIECIEMMGIILVTKHKARLFKPKTWKYFRPFMKRSKRLDN